MNFEIKAEGAKYRLISYSGENGESSVGYLCSLQDLQDLLVQARAALAKQPIVNKGMFALAAGTNRQKPYRLVSYVSDHSDGFRMTTVDTNRLRATLESMNHG
jgi:hypothetical protein